MSRSFTASVLLEQPVPLEIEAVAEALLRRFPQIGKIDTVLGQSEEMQSGILSIDGGHVVITLEPTRCRDGELAPDLKTIKSWDHKGAVSRHGAHVSVSCGGKLRGIGGAKAYAAAVHFVTATLVAETPALGVLWHDGYVVSAPERFLAATSTLLAGRVPLSCWASFACVVPRGYTEDTAMGMVSYGLRPLLGRELELAPRPGSANDAHEWISTVALRALEGQMDLADGMHLTGEDVEYDVTIRERNYWLRRNLTAYVLVAPDAVVEVESLRPRPRRDSAAA